jgi:hypothetical protein
MYSDQLKYARNAICLHCIPRSIEVCHFDADVEAMLSIEMEFFCDRENVHFFLPLPSIFNVFLFTLSFESRNRMPFVTYDLVYVCIL